MYNPTETILIYFLVFFSTALFFYVCIKLFREGMAIYEEYYVSQTSKTLTELFIFQDPRKLFLINIVITVMFLLIGIVITKNIFYILFLGSLGFFIPKLLIWQIQQKRIELFGIQLVDGLMVLSNALRSGMNLMQAIEVLEQEMEPPISQEFGLVTRECMLGVSIEDAMENLSKRVPNDDLKLMVTSINIVAEMGGNLTEIFDSMADMIRERSKLEGKTKALTAQGKLQGVIVGLLPTALGVMMYVMDPQSMERMFNTNMGNVAIGIMVVMQIIGYLMIRKITRIEI